MRTPTYPHFVRHAVHAALALSFCLLAACSPEDDKPDRVSVSSLPCTIDAECSELGFVCDDGRRLCVCTSDSMCADKEGKPYCNAFTGHCVAEIAGCKGDNDCGNNEFCDGALRICRDKKGYCGSCTQDAECGGPNDYCVTHPDFPGSASYCGAACTAEGACEAGQACRDTEKGKQCVPENSRCQSGQSQSCTPDSGQSCGSDADCTSGGGQVCDTASNKCRAANSGCRASQSCDPEKRVCVTSCRFDAECVERYGQNFVCEQDACVPMTSCKDDGDCGADAFCFKMPGSSPSDIGSCQASCRSNDDCFLEQTCSATSPRKCVPGCSKNTDCPLNAICSGGACEFKDPGGAQRCQLQEVCGFKEFCVSNSCRVESKHCGPETSSTSPYCPAGGNRFPLFFNSVCGNGVGLTCPAGSTKKSLRLNVEQCNGFGCQIDRCLHGCEGGAGCPNGFYCRELPDPSNPSVWKEFCYPNDNNTVQCL